MIQNIIKHFRDEKGATMVEYGLLVACISVAVLVLLISIGPELVIIFQTVLNALLVGNA